MTWSVRPIYSCRDCLSQPVLEPDGVNTITNEDAAMEHLENNPSHRLFWLIERVDDPEE